MEEGDWINRYRPGSFSPIGVLWHHTDGAIASPSNPCPSLNTVIVGRADLPGPLCQALLDWNGVFHMISAGRANHAGECGGSGPIPAGDGNTMLIGWEIDYGVTLGQTISPAQYAAGVTGTAAVLRRLGKDSSYARGHRETSVTGKIDPTGVDLNVMRSDVGVRLGSSPPITGDEDMKLIQAPGRGIALVGPGYYRILRNTEEVTEAVKLVGNPIIGNDREFDVWKSITFDGQVKAPNP